MVEAGRDRDLGFEGFAGEGEWRAGGGPWPGRGLSGRGPSAARMWKALTYFVALPGVAVSMLNVYLKSRQHDEHERPEFVPYPHLRIRSKVRPPAASLLVKTHAFSLESLSVALWKTPLACANSLKDLASYTTVSLVQNLQGWEWAGQVAHLAKIRAAGRTGSFLLSHLLNPWTPS